MWVRRLLAQDLADETSPSPEARAQAGLILKNHLTSRDRAQVCQKPPYLEFAIALERAISTSGTHDLTLDWTELHCTDEE